MLLLSTFYFILPGSSPRLLTILLMRMPPMEVVETRNGCVNVPTQDLQVRQYSTHTIMVNQGEFVVCGTCNHSADGDELVGLEFHGSLVRV
jgi:hypothetical protein